MGTSAFIHKPFTGLETPPPISPPLLAVTNLLSSSVDSSILGISIRMESRDAWFIGSVFFHFEARFVLVVWHRALLLRLLESRRVSRNVPDRSSRDNTEGNRESKERIFHPSTWGCV